MVYARLAQRLLSFHSRRQRQTYLDKWGGELIGAREATRLKTRGAWRPHRDADLVDPFYSLEILEK